MFQHEELTVSHDTVMLSLVTTLQNDLYDLPYHRLLERCDELIAEAADETRGHYGALQGIVMSSEQLDWASGYLLGEGSRAVRYMQGVRAATIAFLTCED